MKIQYLPVQSVTPYANNPRQNDAAVEKVAASIRQFGWQQPIVVDSENVIVAGHTRWKAAQLLGLDTVPVHVAGDLSEDEVRAYRLADNKLAELSSWDTDLLATELGSLAEAGFDLSSLGFGDDELAGINFQSGSEELTDPDSMPAAVQPCSVEGDVWCLGPHRLVCGDALDLTTVEALLGGVSADCVWTDPPYNVSIEGKAGKIQNDDMAHEQFAEFIGEALRTMYAVLKPGSPIYVAHPDTKGALFRGQFEAAGFKLASCLVWVKNSLVVGYSDYHWQHEPILYGWRPGARHRWYGKRKQTTVQQLGGGTFVDNGDGSFIVRVGSESILLSGSDIVAEAIESSVIRCERPLRSAAHPTMKPVELIERMLKNSTRTGDVVLDPFGGSGSTLIACERLGRVARLVELDAKYVDVIVRRWEEFTGQHAEHIKGGSFEEVRSGRLPVDVE